MSGAGLSRAALTSPCRPEFYGTPAGGGAGRGPSRWPCLLALTAPRPLQLLKLLLLLAALRCCCFVCYCLSCSKSVWEYTAAGTWQGGDGMPLEAAASSLTCRNTDCRPNAKAAFKTVWRTLARWGPTLIIAAKCLVCMYKFYLCNKYHLARFCISRVRKPWHIRCFLCTCLATWIENRFSFIPCRQGCQQHSPDQPTLLLCPISEISSELIT